ncbi:MAG TPA: SpoIIE family protein phosphatase [Gammaproteobacteria bacterium]|nr:SpoIIE family protein phosphatase [Gammaproteobacteria bacterium]
MKLQLEKTTVDESAQVLVRSKLRAVSRRMGYSEVLRERMELVCNEMMSNQVKYAIGSGWVQLWETNEPKPALDLFAIDRGPGVFNLPAAMVDGYSTSGSLGKGLGAIRRLAHESEFYTLPKGLEPESPWHGFAIWARFYVDERVPQSTYELGMYLRAYQDSTHNGDGIFVRHTNGRVQWLHMDGLGHGLEAAQVVDGNADLLEEELPLEVLIERLSRRLEGGRGAVGMAVSLDAHEQSGAICGVGDMAAFLISNGQKRVISFSPGILGHAHRSLDKTALAFPRQALMITASDGMRRNWSLQTFPSLWRLHPQLIALLMGAVASRVNDDQSILAIRVRSQEGDRP